MDVRGKRLERHRLLVRDGVRPRGHESRGDPTAPPRDPWIILKPGDEADLSALQSQSTNAVVTGIDLNAF